MLKLEKLLKVKSLSSAQKNSRLAIASGEYLECGHFLGVEQLNAFDVRLTV